MCLALGQLAGQASPQQRSRAAPTPIEPTREELKQVQAKTAEIELAVQELKAKHTDRDLVGDVEVYGKAGRMLLEFPDQFFVQSHIDHALAVLDTGLERAKELEGGTCSWATSKKQLHGYYSDLDGSIQPYGITLPANYDASKPSRLYVWLHGRQNQTTESEFLFAFPNSGSGKPPVADNGQIQLDVFGRLNGAGYHWGGEMDVFEAMAAVKKRFKIDEKRILLRGFSMGGEGAWHIALHYPDRFAAAEIGAGTISRRAEMPGLAPYQYAALHIWENMPEWALNIFNLPLAGHDGEHDNQVCCLPPPPAGAPNRGQLESSLRTRAQLEKEGFPAVGDPDFLHSQGTPGIFLVSQDTAHGTSPLVRGRLDTFLKGWGDQGQVSPDRIRFVTWTTRYNRDYWVSIDGLGKTYERADVDAIRSDGGKQYRITTKNVLRLGLREMGEVREINIDGQSLTVRPSAEISLEKSGPSWKTAGAKTRGLHKTHALQGPIDDAFLDPFLLVRPTGTPWNEGANQQSLRMMERFERLWARYFRGHPFVKDDKDVTRDDIARYHLVLFGDPGSNRWIAKVKNRLPLRWTKDTVTLGGERFSAKEYVPALLYPNPLNASKYVVLNTGLTITDREYNGDYGMPRWGDYAILPVKAGADVPEPRLAGLFDEEWQLPKQGQF